MVSALVSKLRQFQQKTANVDGRSCGKLDTDSDGGGWMTTCGSEGLTGRVETLAAVFVAAVSR